MESLKALDEDRLLTIEEVRKFWGGSKPLSPATIYNHIKAGKHPRPIKIGSNSRFLLSELIKERANRAASR